MEGLMNSSKSFPFQVTEAALPDLGETLVNDDSTVVSRIAETNVAGWGLDSFEVRVAEYNPETDAINFKAEIILSGGHNDGGRSHGDTITIVLIGILKYQDGDWYVEDYKINSCEISSV
jgi:hypothetical protein